MERFSMFFGVVLVLFLLVGFGCSSKDNDGTSSPVALTEHDFVDDPELSSDLRDTVAMFLENPTSEEQLSDTYETGIDMIPYYCTETATYSFCWEDGNTEAQHYMKLHDDEGNEILSIYCNGACAKATLEVGQYTMYLYHDGVIPETQTIFIRPNEDDVDTAESSTATTLQYSKFLRIILIATGFCPSCNLRDANLRGVRLCSANLRRADLRRADLRRADLTNADLFCADLRWANLYKAKVGGGTDMSNAKLGGAKYFDGRICGEKSITTCF